MSDLVNVLSKMKETTDDLQAQVGAAIGVAQQAPAPAVAGAKYTQADLDAAVYAARADIPARIQVAVEEFKRQVRAELNKGVDSAMKLLAPTILMPPNPPGPV